MLNKKADKYLLLSYLRHRAKNLHLGVKNPRDLGTEVRGGIQGW